MISAWPLWCPLQTEVKCGAWQRHHAVSHSICADTIYAVHVNRSWTCCCPVQRPVRAECGHKCCSIETIHWPTVTNMLTWFSNNLIKLVENRPQSFYQIWNHRNKQIDMLHLIFTLGSVCQSNCLKTKILHLGEMWSLCDLRTHERLQSACCSRYAIWLHFLFRHYFRVPNPTYKRKHRVLKHIVVEMCFKDYSKATCFPSDGWMSIFKLLLR